MSNNYVIFTDSACDMGLETLEQWNVKCCSLNLLFDGETESILDVELDPMELYNRMREGAVARTSAVNTGTFKEAFEEELKKGNDILYIGFSSGLSTTYNSGRLAADELKEEYPDRTIIAIDTLAASAGQGMLVYLAAQKRDAGISLKDVAEYIENIKLNIAHWVAVDELVYLKRGGRISAASAIVGGILDIKPIIHVDNDGKLINVGKVRGRKASLKTLVDKYASDVLDKNGPIFICNSDCMEDVETIKTMLKQQHGVNVDKVVSIGSVIGSHTGPGTIAIFFIGKNR